MKINGYWLISLTFLYNPMAGSEIVTDGSLTGAVQSVAGPVYNITPDFGKVSGSNLFHSFSQFNIYRGETANFQASLAINNIFTRVTGGNVSEINGTLNSSSTANLWLINPTGWMVGKDAAINVNGALHFTTAQAIGFSDGGLYFADPASQSSLTESQPVDYQFTEQQVQATITIDATDILLEPGKDFSVVGGNIQLQDSHIHSQGGRIMLGSNLGTGRWQEDLQGLRQESGGRGSIQISQTTSDSLTNPTLAVNERPSTFDAQTGGGKIELIGGNIDIKNVVISARAVSDQKSGAINLDGLNTRLDSSTLTTSTSGSQDGGLISIQGKDLTLTASGVQNSFIKADTQLGSTGKSGAIDINLQGVLKLDQGSSISSKLLGSGNGSDINITSHDVALDQQSSISVATTTSGNSGNIKLTADQLSLDGNSNVSSSTNIGQGNAGNIMIASNNIRLQNISLITSSSFKQSNGMAGNISIAAKDTVASSVLQLRQSKIGTSLLGSKGDGGDIQIDTGVMILNGGTIQANSAAQGGKGGTVIVNAGKSIYSGDQLLIGGDQPHNFDFEYNFNVIQAAAKNGTSGVVKVSPVSLYLAGQLAKVDAIFANDRSIIDDPCSIRRGAETSTLIQLGHGGLPSRASDPISPSLQRYLQDFDQMTEADTDTFSMPIVLYAPNSLCQQDRS